MVLACGTKLGPYEILSPLGAGGMGEVYRARDTRLERDVAVKVLPANLSSDPSLRQRMEREAKAVSKLSHPHTCTLHDIGHQDGVDFLVMELVEGEGEKLITLQASLPLQGLVDKHLARAGRRVSAEPRAELSQYTDRNGRGWGGDCYRSFVRASRVPESRSCDEPPDQSCGAPRLLSDSTRG